MECMYRDCPHDEACVDGCHCPMPERQEAVEYSYRAIAWDDQKEFALAWDDQKGFLKDRERPELPPNPKQRYGDLKPNVALNPGTASAYQALAHENGAAKYGPFNWREKSVELMTYVASAKRHLDAWVDREEFSADTADTNKPVHNLGHVMASIAILIDALETPGCAIDNRPKAGGSSRLHERVKELRSEARIDVV